MHDMRSGICVDITGVGNSGIIDLAVEGQLETRTTISVRTVLLPSQRQHTESAINQSKRI